MDSCDDDPSPLSSSSSSSTKDVEHLLDQSWFFGHVLCSKQPQGMSRCFSDPSPSFDPKLLASNNGVAPASSANLIRAPSLPPYIGRPEEVVEPPSQQRGSCRKLNRQFSDLSLVQKSSVPKGIASIPKGIISKESMLPRQPAKNRLLRTPSLPSPSIQVVSDQEEDDSDISMGRLICEAISNSPETLPPRSHSSKGASMQKNRSARSLRELGNQNQKQFRKSLSDLEPQEVQGFKDLGFRFNQKDLNPSVVAVLSGLQDKKIPDEDKVKRPYYYYARTCAAPPIPVWANRNSTQDIKLQLKHWARAVASNAR